MVEVNPMEEQRWNLVPLYAAKVENLVHAPAIGVTCTCGHISTVAVAFIMKRVSADMPIKSLHHHLRCTNATGGASAR
jgi:hypothetical protein